MTRRHAAAVVAVFSLVGMACRADNAPPPGPVSVSGTVLGADGQPLSESPVVLVSEADLGETALACLSSTCGSRAATGADGSFSFTVPRGDGGWYQLASGGAEGGPTASARFRMTGDVRLPPLRMWAPKVELTVGRTVRASWEPRDPAAQERVAFIAAGGSIVWMAGGSGSIANDGRVLEDSRGMAVVESIGESELGDGAVRLTYRSAPVPFTGATGPPPSRTRPCSPDPCVLTDGDLVSPGGKEAPNQLSIDLGASTTVRLIVVRGCPGRCSVETSVDGLAWKIVGSGDDPFFSVTPAVGPDVRYLRVRSPNPLTPLAEVSAW